MLISHHSCIWQLQLYSYDVSNKYRLRCSVIGRPTGRSVQPVGRSVHTLRQSDRQSDETKHVWFFRSSLRPVERSVYTIRSLDWPVGLTIVPYCVEWEVKLYYTIPCCSDDFCQLDAQPTVSEHWRHSLVTEILLFFGFCVTGLFVWRLFWTRPGCPWWSKA